MATTYWNHNGEEQAKYDEMVGIGWIFTNKTKQIFHSYYRYFNDGDLPGWARKDWMLRRFNFIRNCWELNDDGLEILEQRTTEAILNEHKRFRKYIQN